MIRSSNTQFLHNYFTQFIALGDAQTCTLDWKLKIKGFIYNWDAGGINSNHIIVPVLNPTDCIFILNN